MSSVAQSSSHAGDWRLGCRLWIGQARQQPRVVGYQGREQPASGVDRGQLARKADVCEGAEPQQHSHFFTEDGRFGSLDQHGEQVDDASYRIVGEDRLRLDLEFGTEEYRYRIADGNQLTLEPIIPARAKREALEHPLAFHLAGHMAAVAYAGRSWKRVDCDGWC